jgi:hypothetical protein
MDDDKFDIRKRDLLKGIGVTGFSAIGLAGVGSAKRKGRNLPGKGPGRGGRGRGRYPIVEEGLYADAPLQVAATESAMHPHQNRAAFTSTAFGDGYELYLAEGVDSTSDVPEQILRVTESSFFVNNLRWRKGNRLQYQRDFDMFIRKIPPSNKVFEPEPIEENAVQGGD